MIAIVLAFSLAVLAIWIAISTLRDFREDFARFDFWWTYPKLEAARSEDSVGFWLIVLSKLVIIGTMLFFASNLVRAA